MKEEPRIYDGAGDIEQMQVFLKQKNEQNAEILGWDIEDPKTWDGVVFNGDDIVSINLKGRGIVGTMELIYFSKLKTLDVSDNPELRELDCSYNQIETLDISGNTGLRTLNCGGNRLSSIDVGDNLNLERFSCRGNMLTSLDVSKNTKLLELYCYDNKISEFDLSRNNELVTLYCGGNPISEIDVSGHKNLMLLNCDDSENLSLIDVRDCTSLRYIYCWNTNVSAKNIRGVGGNVALLMDYKKGFVNYRPVNIRKIIFTFLTIISIMIDLVMIDLLGLLTEKRRITRISENERAIINSQKRG